jgi:hypothetical protein
VYWNNQLLRSTYINRAGWWARCASCSRHGRWRRRGLWLSHCLARHKPLVRQYSRRCSWDGRCNQQGNIHSRTGPHLKEKWSCIHTLTSWDRSFPEKN